MREYVDNYRLSPPKVAPGTHGPPPRWGGRTRAGTLGSVPVESAPERPVTDAQSGGERDGQLGAANPSPLTAATGCPDGGHADRTPPALREESPRGCAGRRRRIGTRCALVAEQDEREVGQARHGRYPQPHRDRRSVSAGQLRAVGWRSRGSYARTRGRRPREKPPEPAVGRGRSVATAGCRREVGPKVRDEPLRAWGLTTGARDAP